MSGSVAPAYRGKQKDFADRADFRCCALVLFFCVAASLPIGAQFSRTLWSFTPLYQPVECTNQSAVLREFVIEDDSVQLTLNVSISCLNSNTYSVMLVPDDPGNVYFGIGPFSLKAGQVSLIPTRLPPFNGKFQTAWGLAVVALHGSDVEELRPHLLEDQSVPISLRLQFRLIVEVQVGCWIFPWTADIPLGKDCGANIRGIQYQVRPGPSMAHSRLGRLVCGDHGETLSLPEVSGEKLPSREEQLQGLMVGSLSVREQLHGVFAKVLGIGFPFIIVVLIMYCAFRQILRSHNYFRSRFDTSAESLNRYRDWQSDNVVSKAMQSVASCMHDSDDGADAADSDAPTPLLAAAANGGDDLT